MSSVCAASLSYLDKQNFGVSVSRKARSGLREEPKISPKGAVSLAIMTKHPAKSGNFISQIRVRYPVILFSEFS